MSHHSGLGWAGLLLCAACARDAAPVTDVDPDASPDAVVSADPDADAPPPTPDARPPAPDAAACVPVPEVCDGLDDDCDGEIDNDATCPDPNTICRFAACVPIPPDGCPVPKAAPVPVVQASGDLVTLDARPSTDAESPNRRPVRFQWVLVESPAGSSARAVERISDNPQAPYDDAVPDDDTTPRAELVPDVAGTYTIQLVVTDSVDQIAPSEACPDAPDASRVSFEVAPGEVIRVEMWWHTPGDPNEHDRHGSDVDLHMLHPRGQRWSTNLDCYYANPDPDWGAVGDPTDNPALILDDISGAGPEIMLHARPENTDALGSPFRVGVEYYRSESLQSFEGYGPSEVTLAVYLQGMLAWQNDVPKVLERTLDFWEPVHIFWTDSPRIEVVDRLN